MSAFPPKADVRHRGRHVRFVPKADILKRHAVNPLDDCDVHSV